VKSKLNYMDVACTFPLQHDVHDGQNGEFIRLFKVERNDPRCRTGWILDTYKIFSKIRLLILRSSLSFFLFFFFVLFICFFFVLFFVLIIYYFCIIFLPLPLPLPLPLVLYSLGPIGKTSGGVQGRWKGHGLLLSYDKPGIRITKVTIYHVLKHFILRMWGQETNPNGYISSMKGLVSCGKKIKEIVEQIVR